MRGNTRIALHPLKRIRHFTRNNRVQNVVSLLYFLRVADLNDFDRCCLAFPGVMIRLSLLASKRMGA